jgi:purine-binding chemotaxis protein CheW
MTQMFLIAVVAGIEVAISSDCIESVIQKGDVVAVPGTDPLVAGLIALRSRVLTLIDCQCAVTGVRSNRTEGNLAVIVSVGGHAYGLMVDAVKDVLSVSPDAVKSATKVNYRWQHVVTQMVEVEGRMVMLLSPELLLKPQLAAAA